MNTFQLLCNSHSFVRIECGQHLALSAASGELYAALPGDVARQFVC